MSKQYKNPPIIEAVCEFRFGPGSNWDLTVPGLVFKELREEFPQRRQARHFSLKMSAATQAEIQAAERMHFLREDESALIQVGPNFLAINRLKPYESWNEFLPIIKKGLNAYRKIVEPSTIQRVGLRYINHVQLNDTQKDSVPLSEYFNIYPFIGETFSQNLLNSFNVGVQVAYEQTRDNLKLTLSSLDAVGEQESLVLLDLDYYLAQPDQIDLDEVIDWIQVAHAHLEEAFEASITDKLRNLFEGN